MSFTYSAIGDNTRENREHLEKLGIKGYNRDRQFIIVHEGYYFCTDEYMKVHYPCVGCVNNPALFQAVTAMRSDSDYMQWFKTDFENKLIPDVKEMYLCESREFCGITVKYKGEDFVIGSAGFHKATLSELQQHFK